MPPRRLRPRKRWTGALTAEQQFALLNHDADQLAAVFGSLEVARGAWEAHRSALPRQGHLRPEAFWVFEAPLELQRPARVDSYEWLVACREVRQCRARWLLDNDLLSDEERERACVILKPTKGGS